MEKYNGNNRPKENSGQKLRAFREKLVEKYTQGVNFDKGYSDALKYAKLQREGIEEFIGVYDNPDEDAFLEGYRKWNGAYIHALNNNREPLRESIRSVAQLYQDGSEEEGDSWDLASKALVNLSESF